MPSFQALTAAMGISLLAVGEASPAMSPTAAAMICEEGGSGLFLPIDGASQDWPSGVQALVYFIGLIWCFMGVGIIADIFMAAIEVITSKTHEVVRPDGSKAEVKVWNATVANLTLMALGSSAPEIILSVIEIMSLDFYSGALGPSTIVGSAAFNLLCIMAVCVVAIPPGDDLDNPDGRKIADLTVYTVTCTWGIFAYVWLLIILVLPPTPDVVSLYEGILTFLFFPITVAMAYAADQGWFNKNKVAPQSHVVGMDGLKIDRSSASEMLAKMDGVELSIEEKAKLMVAMSAGEKPSRAQLRMQAVRMMSGGKRVVAPPPNKALMAKYTKANQKHTSFFFGDADGAVCTKYAVLESNPLLTVHVMRFPSKGAATIKYKSVDIPGGAKAGEDYEGVDAVLEFADGESTKDITIKIMDDDAVEDDEKFLIKLYEPSDGTAVIENDTAEITIIDDDEPGEVGFAAEELFKVAKQSAKTLHVPVKRQHGSSGKITVKYRTEVAKMKTPLEEGKTAAVEGTDFEAAAGTLVFENGEVEKVLDITVINTGGAGPKNVAFELVLFDCVGPVDRACLTENNVAQVTIVDDENTKAIMELAMKIQAEQAEKYSVETVSWGQQFSDALTIERDDGEEDLPWTALPKGTLVMHFITVPWKLAFATCPPTIYGGGWVCFFSALMLIGVVTGLIGDLASLFGCSLGLPDSTTAITFVALGTSLPDTFASKAAAQSDDTADAAIGNVTGSNAVNVFLGLGLPWMMAAFVWEGRSSSYSDEDKLYWIGKYGDNANMKDYIGNFKTTGNFDQIKPVFVVEAGSLGASVAIFVCCALVCVGTLAYRRKTYGMELGGPPGPAKAASAFMVGLWGVYIVGSILTTG